MQRLFTALSLPEKTAKQLTALQLAGDGVQAVETAQLHITLHFIGQAEANELADVLERVRAPVFSLQIEGPGKFNQANGAFILWAGVQKSEGLMTLYQELAGVLSNRGYPNTSMDYIPHITLARCKNGTPNTLADKFINRTLPPFEPFAVTEFGLYSSSLYKGKSIYRRERVFSLEFS